jgi:DNA-binding beta-propeller fold protein YncE
LTGAGRGLALALLLAAAPAAAANPLDVLDRIEVDREPIGLAVDGAGRVLAVAADGKTVLAIDGSAGSMTIEERLDLSAYGRLNRAAVDPTSGRIYVTASVSGAVLEIDPDLSRVIRTVTGLSFPQALVIDGDNLLVVETGRGTVSVIDLATFTSVRRLKASDRPHMIDVDRAARRLIVLHAVGRAIRYYDLERDYAAVGGLSWPYLTRPQDLAATAGGEYLVVDGVYDELQVIAPDGQEPGLRLRLTPDDCGNCAEFSPMAVSLSPEGGVAAVVGRSGRISLIDLSTKRLVASERVGLDLRDVLFLPDGRIAVSSFATHEVIVLRGTQRMP